MITMLQTLLFAESILEGALGGALKGAIVGAIVGPLIWLFLQAQKRWGSKVDEEKKPPPTNS